MIGGDRSILKYSRFQNNIDRFAFTNLCLKVFNGTRLNQSSSDATGIFATLNCQNQYPK